MFTLSKIQNYSNIVIQCHNNPDADTIACGFAIYMYCLCHNINARLIYSGSLKITKVNLIEMISKLIIPIHYVENIDKAEALIMVDCQYSAGNVTTFEAETVIVIDHHKEEVQQSYLGVINAQLGSCSTIIWDLLRKETFDFEANKNVATALYYGLYTDTNSLAEIYHPLDKDMRDNLECDRNLIKHLQNTNLTIDELKIAALTLTNYRLNHNLCYAVFKADPCDPNILGFISDLALQVNTISACVVYNETQNGVKLSIRSCSREITASDFADFITKGVGSGGGHREKAGGFINKSALIDLNLTVDQYIENRTFEYFTDYDVIDHEKHNLDIASMPAYRKKKIAVGYVASTDIFKNGTPVMIRTLEGDSEAVASQDIYFMIGVLGEVYPITMNKFSAAYKKTDDVIEANYDYSPTVRNKNTGEIFELVKYIKACVSLGEIYIYALQLKRSTKVFTKWTPESYMSGHNGDYIAVRSDDLNDVYIIKENIFSKTYDKV